jgi:hypothetical protein
MTSKRIDGNIRRDLYVLEDENNPHSSHAENVLPSTILDQVYDDQSPTKKNLREILEELRQEIITGGRGNIVFPVTSVNNKTDDVVITKKDIGLEYVDNTRDIDKPLSSPQRNAIMDILRNYDFNVNLDDLYNHLKDNDNPHNVTIDQLNKNEELSRFVKQYIGIHNTSNHNSVHADIRGSLRRLWTIVDGMNNSVDEKIEKFLKILNDHLDDDFAHINIFNKKEDVSNKVMSFSATTITEDSNIILEDIVTGIKYKLIVENIKVSIKKLESSAKAKKAILTDINSRLNYSIIVNNGVLSILETDEPANLVNVLLVDENTDIGYKLSIADKKLVLYEIESGTIVKYENVDHTKYPSTRAVVEFVAEKLVEFNRTLPDVKHWIDDIIVVDTRNQLPRASASRYHTVYFIRNGLHSYNEIAICRKNPGNSGYDWHFSSMGSYGSYNPEHFENTPDGLSIKMNHIVDSVLDENGPLIGPLSEALLKDYYTKSELDDFKYINHIKILPGTTDGTIRFYVNDNMRTMSNDIRIAGLKRLAYLEWVTEDQIWDHAIHERHILNKAVAHRHIQDRAVSPVNIECPIGYIIGNDKDSTNPTANSISLEQLAEYLRPLIGGWPDPNVPGGNPWYDRLSTQIMQTHVWLPGVEYPFGNGGYGVRFKGTISCIANMPHKLKLSENLTPATGYQIMDAGGSWMYQSEPDVEWTIIGGSNITGHTYATITMDKDGLYLETISVGDRINAPYDIWVKYVRLEELEKYPVLEPSIPDQY